jgi:phage-related baseplate assembly protein
MTRFIAIDLAGMDPPDIIETLDFETILQALKADMSARMEDEGLEFDVQDLESDPAVKILEVAAAREIHLRARVNGAAKALLLALAHNNDLEHLGAWFGVERQVITPAVLDGNGDVITPAVMENDERLRHRIQLAPQAFSTAGPIGAYEYHALTAAPTIKSVNVISPRPGIVQVFPLSMIGDGEPSEAELKAIRLWLAAEDVRPLTDQVQVISPSIIHMNIDLTLLVKQGPDAGSIADTVEESVREYADSRHQVGAVLRRSAIYQHAHIADAVDSVVINVPTEDVDPGPRGAIFVDDVLVRTKTLIPK